MIVRLVRMTLQPQLLPRFLTMFRERKSQIRGFDGCLHLELWQDANNAAVVYTYSHWETEQHLNAYRFSGFFKETWALTKPFFSEKAIASTLTVVQ